MDLAKGSDNESGNKEGAATKGDGEGNTKLRSMGWGLVVLFHGCKVTTGKRGLTAKFSTKCKKIFARGEIKR